MNKLWEWFIEWLFGDQKQLSASITTHPVKTISKILLVFILTAIGVMILAFLGSWAASWSPSSHSPQMVFNNSTITVYTNTTSSQSDNSNPIPSIASSDTIVMRPPLINNTTPPPVLAVESLGINLKAHNGFHSTMVFILGVAAGTGAPTINSVSPPPLITSCESLGNSQPGVAINGIMQYRIVYFFEYDCISNEPISTGTPLAFGLNYSWSSLHLTSSTQ
jgi:hypothetical protein